MDLLFKKWLPLPEGCGSGSFQKFHPEYIAMKDSLHGMRQRADDSVESTAIVSLPVEVETNIVSVQNVGYNDSATRLLIIRRQRCAENYTAINDQQEFELLWISFL